MREVKLPAMLKQLVDEGEYRGNRRWVSTQLGITPAALSQYINGQTNPSLEKLLAMIELFDVSLDFLVFGPDTIGQHANAEAEAVTASIQADIATHSALVGKVGEILAQQIDAATRSVAKRPSTLSNMLDQKQALELERYSEDSTIVTMDLTDDIVEVDSEQEVTAGDFLTVVAQNLAQGRTYHFVLSPEMEDHDTLIQRYRTLLLDQHLSEADLRNCRFSIGLDSFYVGCCLFRLDVDGLKRHSPVLHRYLESFITHDNYIGYIEPPSSPLRAYFLLDADRMQVATRVLERLAPPSSSSS
ncbi:helix-turn-helix transcriptional regulator [Nocardia sp. NPDC051832]|uniref:helix-turn-helix domain-containing protein n=1 Tax=Nocardia sp. NPDC051832 TaxID=3155673 RepID=UPI0034343850